MREKDIFKEDARYGIYDRPGVSEEEAAGEETTVPDEVPLSPSQHMSNQISVQRPPIEDEDYIPSSIEELSRAASAIAQLTPNESISFFYRQLHKLLDDATDKASEHKQEDDLKDSFMPVKESDMRNSIRRNIVEMLGPDDMRDYEEFRTGYSVTDPEEEDETSANKDELSLDDLAKEFGYSGAPGIRQEIERLTDRLTYFATKVKKEDLDALVAYAVGEFIDALEESETLGDQDIEDLRVAPKLVRDLESFRYFFVSAFVLPAYKQVVKAATKKVKTEISQMGIPKELQQTVFNQVTGAATRKPALIKKKVDALVSSGKLSAEEAPELVQKIESSREVLVAASDYSDDFIQRSLDRWQSTSKPARLKALQQAMETTLSS